MKFLIQTIDNKIRHDFAFHLLESIEYQEFAQNKIDYILCDISKIKEFKGFIPIGSVEFVTQYIEYFYSITLKPINVPEELFPFANRNIFNGTEKDIIGEKFVKSNDVIKGFSDICSSAPKGNYQISDVIDIESEWRIFVFRDKIVHISNYLGDCLIFPDISIIKKIISEYKNKPVAFTLDVGILKNTTFVVEIHDFFSCGLYGFCNYNILPYMFSQWFHEFIRKNTYFIKNLDIL